MFDKYLFRYFNTKAIDHYIFLKILTIIIPACDNSTDFTCTSGKCISKSMYCNSVSDCEDDSDEISCGRFLLFIYINHYAIPKFTELQVGKYFMRVISISML